MHTVSLGLYPILISVLAQIDHFGFLENGMFKQRYLVNDQHWHENNGPILFYTGNEGDVTWFCNNTVIIPFEYFVLVHITHILVGIFSHRIIITNAECMLVLSDLTQGFMWDVAEELGAMLVFAEHRYYGESMPFGNESYSVSKVLL